MKVELPKGIKAIHGRLGDYIFRSYRQPDGSYKVFAYCKPRKGTRQLRDNYETFTRHLREMKLI